MANKKANIIHAFQAAGTEMTQKAVPAGASEEQYGFDLSRNLCCL